MLRGWHVVGRRTLRAVGKAIGLKEGGTQRAVLFIKNDKKPRIFTRKFSVQFCVHSFQGIVKTSGKCYS